jgi:hypothetical protein
MTSIVHQVTIFQSIKDTSTPFYRNVSVILGRIKSGASKELVKKIRAEKRKPERNELKKKLPAVCFSGKFTKRADSYLVGSDMFGLRWIHQVKGATAGQGEPEQEQVRVLRIH